MYKKMKEKPKPPKGDDKGAHTHTYRHAQIHTHMYTMKGSTCMYTLYTTKVTHIESKGPREHYIMIVGQGGPDFDRLMPIEHLLHKTYTVHVNVNLALVG